MLHFAGVSRSDCLLLQRVTPSGPAPDPSTTHRTEDKDIIQGAAVTNVYQGQCFCGAVQIEVSGHPEVMAYCHCHSCRSWSGSPVHASTMWKAPAVKLVAGAPFLGTFHKTPESISHRQYCTLCAGHLMIHHPAFDLFDVMAATLPGLKFEPSLHVNYSETVLRMRDGLPKFKNFPTDFGGSGELLPE